MEPTKCTGGFLPTPSARRATWDGKNRFGLPDISTHALREEGDPCRLPLSKRSSDFYPRPPRGGRPTAPLDTHVELVFLPTPSARRATSTPSTRCSPATISTHALREEGDGVTATPDRGDQQFLPTPSARRATARCCSPRPAAPYFYPRPPRGGRRSGGTEPDGFQKISTHALREEGDPIQPLGTEVQHDFYPRPPRGGRPRRSAACSRRRCDFYPRPPRGGRRTSGPSGRRSSRFLPTPSARRATGGLLLSSQKAAISTHALREEGDQASFLHPSSSSRFLPTPSARRATDGGCPRRRAGRISTHALREEGDKGLPSSPVRSGISTHALREEGDPALRRPPRQPRAISTHALREEGDS